MTDHCRHPGAAFRCWAFSGDLVIFANTIGQAIDVYEKHQGLSVGRLPKEISLANRPFDEDVPEHPITTIVLKRLQAGMQLPMVMDLVTGLVTALPPAVAHPRQ